MANAHLESLYTVLDQSTTLLRRNLNVSALEAAIETGDNLLSGEVTHADGLPDASTTQALEKLYAQITLDTFTAEEIRQAWQLVLVKIIAQDQIEPNKQVTPDALASLASYLVTVFYPAIKTELSVGDLAVGTGNLLYAVMNQLHTALDVPVKGFGVDNDETLLAFAGMSSALQHLDVQLFHQDGIDTPVFNGMDIMVSDLPVGYYPLDDRAKALATAAKEGHSYAHHLLIEQSMQLLKPGGLGLFFVPSNVFQSEEANGLTSWLTQAMHFQGLLTLPTTMFASASAQKSLLVLQRPGGTAVQAKQVLLGEFPDLNDKDAFSKFLSEINHWADQNIRG